MNKQLAFELQRVEWMHPKFGKRTVSICLIDPPYTFCVNEVLGIEHSLRYVRISATESENETRIFPCDRSGEHWEGLEIGLSEGQSIGSALREFGYELTTTDRTVIENKVLE